MTISAASLAQMKAAHPDRNTWLLANAGSGKTKVLTDRVARLLLNGVEPQHILCLTYTKAAASEMQNRLFQRLGAWAMKPDDDLRRDLLELGEEEMAAPRLARARQLFARAIETPGGLRIQTIHSFCASLLRRFPLEAGVPPGFTEMDDRAARLMRAEIVEELADRLAPDVVGRVTSVYSGEDFTKLINQIARDRAAFAQPQDEAEVWRMFGLPDGFTATKLLSEVFLGDEVRWLPDVIGLLAAGSANDVKAAEKLGRLDLVTPTLAGLEVLESVLLFGTGTKDPDKYFTAKIGDFPTQDTRKRLGDLTDRLNTLMARVETARQPRLTLLAAQKTLVLHQFAAAFLPVYAARKAARGLLDFEDLIDRARSLLTDPARAAWVLYRLDGGIEHILVDEAQDTSPDQWELIESLAAELTAGQGASNRQRTLFVVGDKKQSIYSFQGADVAAFDRKRDFFRSRLADGAGLVEGTLSHSFRSSPAILTVVDQTFTEAERDAIGGESSHQAFNETLAGRVDVWPVVESPEKPEKGVWFEPLDLPHPEDAEVRLARDLAARIKALVDSGEQIPVVPRNGGPATRPVHYGDFLILVQRRSPLFHEIIRACKALALPIAGADRLKLGGEMAVKDLSALLSFLDTPEDDLSLAATLRSPLCGWTEAELFKLAQGRKGYLWQALRDATGHAETVDFLNDLRGQADFLRPYDLIERVLHRHDGRRKLLARLGAEAEDGIDELLSQALAYEVSDVPSLTGFLVWMETDDVEVKRQLDGEGHQIRVMTVHGAKGLEAEIVILPDTGDRDPPQGDELLRLPDRRVVWKVPAGERPQGMAMAHADAQARALAERLRLLYVAMTRARCWLIVVAKGEVKKPDCWYNLIRAGVNRAGGAVLDDGALRYSLGDWPTPLLQASGAKLPVTLPGWVSEPLRDPARESQVLSPSDLGGAKALPGEPAQPDADAKARGTALHLLLERLPLLDPARWAEMAAALIPDAALAADLLAEARLVLQDAHLSPLFAPDTLAEVAVTAPWQGRVLAGSIDRLVIAADRVLIIDYKSNAVIPETPDQVPEGILRQMGAYAHMLGAIYPDRRIDVAILWTRGPHLMPLDPEIVRQAFSRTAIP
ncbi:RecB ATP-dependent exoDNAse (exonuclease V) beta subunit (contains helicase and exonuclease domains) [Paracoccaceae bacterium]